MRKYIRKMIRNSAKAEKAKPSIWLRAVFDHRQNKKFGTNIRSVNKAKGTHKKKLWRQRINLATS